MKDKVYLVQEYCQGGSLLEYLAKKGGQPVEEEVVRGITKQLVRVVRYLKKCNVVHRDIKPENILLTGQLIGEGGIPEVKLGDLGLSGIVGGGRGETLTQPYGTIIYAAPEILCDRAYDWQVDVYSLGVTVFGVCSSRVPFKKGEPSKLLE